MKEIDEKWQKEVELFPGRNGGKVKTIRYRQRSKNNHLTRMVHFIDFDFYPDGFIETAALGNKNSPLYPECIKMGFAKEHEYQCNFRIKTNDKIILRNFLAVVHKYESLDEIYADIFSSLQITDLTKIQFLLDNKNYLKAMEECKTALDSHDDSVISFFTDAITSYTNKLNTNEIDTLIELYLSLSEKNPYYKKANIFILDFLNQFFPTNEENKFYYLELKLRFALRAGVERQAECNQIYHELCGHLGAIDKGTPDIKGDVDVLIFLARQIRTLIAENGKSQSRRHSLTMNFGEKPNVTGKHDDIIEDKHSTSFPTP